MRRVDEYLQCLNPNPGPCDSCARLKYPCKTTTQRKRRPLYFTSDEQFQWIIAIIQHFLPDIDLELDGLKAAGAKLGIAAPAHPVAGQTPRLSLPPSLEAPSLQHSESSHAQSDVMGEKSPSPERSASEEEVGDDQGEEKEGDISAEDLMTEDIARLDEQSPAELSSHLESRNAKPQA